MTAALDTRAGVGDLLRAWRVRRRLSQLDLACLADVSTRHLSYVETGRARPSRGFLLHLADHLDVPLRGRNDLLVAAGYAPVFGETALDEPEMASVRHALDLVLAHHDPYPAIVVDRLWDLVLANDGAALLLEDVASELLSAPVNVLRLSLHPGGFGSRIADFATFSGHLLGRLRRQVAMTGDEHLAALYEELVTYSGVETVEPWTEHPGVVLPVRVHTSRGVLSFFTTLATFGTASDVTLAELAVEQFFPADEATRQALSR
ncbi:MAG: helix-turn-helix transcriptional regulator [Actinobacteria bacterium]|nr:helix-turn-helix transcriptional regulator [Actinomycetota bacterium]MCA1721532.1 helix-turn-helix transcriptional regulator [Actinomycetota bacterium]